MKLTFRILQILAVIAFSCIATATLAGKQPPEKLAVVLDWLPNPDHAPLILAKQLGYFKDENLDVQLITPANDQDPSRKVAAGAADLGITYEPEFLEDVDHGKPLIQIGTLIDRPLDCIVALKEQGIHEIKDLKGKRIGAGSSSGVSTIILKTMLRNNGLSEKDIVITSVKENLSRALLSRDVDAVSGMTRNFEIPQIEAKNKQVVTFLPEEHGVPKYSELIFIAHIKNAHDPRFPRFLNAIKKAVLWLDEHPQQAWNQFVKVYPQANNQVNRAAWFATMPYFSEEPAAINEKDLRNFAAFMHDHKMISKLQPTSRYAIILE